MGHYYSGGRRRRVGCQFPSSGENTRLSFPRIRKTNSTVGRGPGKLTRTVLTAGEHDAMIRRRAALAGIATKLATTALPATGVTAYLKNGGAEPRSRSILSGPNTGLYLRGTRGLRRSPQQTGRERSRFFGDDQLIDEA